MKKLTGVVLEAHRRHCSGSRYWLERRSCLLEKKCSHCIVGKQHQLTFKSGPSRRSKVLELVHTDVYLMGEKTLGGVQYYVTFIDEYSRKVWAYTLKTKDQVLSEFKKFHAAVERETGQKVKVVRSDNGGEYRGPFEEYCREQYQRPRSRMAWRKG